MTFQHVVRRLHLYLGMFLLPWFLMYGVSSLPFSHNQWFRREPRWTARADRPYNLELAPDSNLREAGARIMRDLNLDGSFGAYRPNDRQLNVYRFTFLDVTRITYHLDQKRLVAEDRGFHWPQFLTGMHARGGFEQDSVLSDAWAVTVDVVCIAMILWIATGVYMWWQLPSSRNWGWLAIGGGAASFIWFTLAL
jgi:hypothetical protein